MTATITRPQLVDRKAAERLNRNNAVIADYNDGCEVPELMVKHSLSQPTIYRILREARRAVDIRD